MRRLIMLFPFQGCLGLSFKNWTGLQDLKDLQDRLFWLSCGLTMDRIAGLQDLKDLQKRVHGLNWGLTLDKMNRIVK